ncbi:hypothetical protein DIPPA_26580 [Diplonema papillatum]|nr:hypothetical protein DIPPA_26580 [Diplonema papillatum]
MPLVRKTVREKDEEDGGSWMLISITEDGRTIAVGRSAAKKATSKKQCVVFRVLKKILLAVADDIRVRSSGVQCLRHDDVTARLSLPKGVEHKSFLERCRKKAPILLSTEYIAAGTRSADAALSMSRSRQQRAEQRGLLARKAWEAEFGEDSSADDAAAPPAAAPQPRAKAKGRAKPTAADPRSKQSQRRAVPSAEGPEKPAARGAGKRGHGSWPDIQLAHNAALPGQSPEQPSADTAERSGQARVNGASNHDSLEECLRPPADNAGRSSQARVNGGGSYDSLGAAKCLRSPAGNRRADSFEDSGPSPKRQKREDGESRGVPGCAAPSAEDADAALAQALRLLEEQKQLLTRRHEEIKQALEAPAQSGEDNWLDYYVKNFGFCVYMLCSRHYPKGSTLRHSATESSKVIARKDTKKPYIVRPNEPVLMVEEKDTKDTFSKVFTQDKTQGYVRTAALVAFRDNPAGAVSPPLSA